MQKRMQEHPLSPEQIRQLLHTAPVGVLTTMNSEGYPYSTPVHFLYHQNKIYIHGLARGEKINNLSARPQVGFTVYNMQGLLLGDSPCQTNTAYESVIMTGTARLIQQIEQKGDILSHIVAKYTPHLKGQTLPASAIAATAIIEMIPRTCSGKYYR